MWCPLEDIELALDKCPVRCMYNSEGLCRYAVVKEAQRRASEITDTRGQPAIMSKIVSLPNADRAARRIKAFVYIDSYVQFILNKSLPDLTRQDVATLRDEQRFYRWPRSRPNSYPVLDQVLSLVEQQIKG